MSDEKLSSVVITATGDIVHLRDGQVVPRDEGEQPTYAENIATGYAGHGYATRIIGGMAVAVKRVGTGVAVVYTDHHDDGTSEIIWSREDLQWLIETCRQHGLTI